MVLCSGTYCLRLLNFPILSGHTNKASGPSPVPSSAIWRRLRRNLFGFFPTKIWRKTVTRRAAHPNQKIGGCRRGAAVPKRCPDKGGYITADTRHSTVVISPLSHNAPAYRSIRAGCPAQEGCISFFCSPPPPFESRKALVRPAPHAQVHRSSQPALQQMDIVCLWDSLGILS